MSMIVERPIPRFGHTHKYAVVPPTVCEVTWHINGQEVSMHDEVGGLSIVAFHSTYMISVKVVGDYEGTTISAVIKCDNQLPRHLGPMLVGSGEWGTPFPNPVDVPEDNGPPTCKWSIERTYGAPEAINRADGIALIHGVIKGGDAQCRASVSSSIAYWMIATRDISEALSGHVRINVMREASCANPIPKILIDARSVLRISAEAVHEAKAGALAYTTITGDANLENTNGAESGSQPSSTKVSIGPVEFLPARNSDGKVAPLDSPQSVTTTVEKSEAMVNVEAGFALKAMVDGANSLANARVNMDLDGLIEARCENCGASRRAGF